MAYLKMVFSIKHYFFSTNSSKKFLFCIQCWNSNRQPLEHESSPITTRPGPRPKCNLSCCFEFSLDWLWSIFLLLCFSDFISFNQECDCQKKFLTKNIFFREEMCDCFVQTKIDFFQLFVANLEMEKTLKDDSEVSN